MCNASKPLCSIRRPRPAIVCALLVAAAAHAAPAAAQLTRAVRGFITPLDAALVLAPDHPRAREACRYNDRDVACPLLLKYGNDAAGPGPFVPPVFTSYAPHLFLSFTFRDVTNTPVTPDGVRTRGIAFDFWFDSSVSSLESPVEFSGHGLGPNGDIPPGESETFNSIHWRAIVLNGCTSPPSVIPIEHLNRVTSLRDDHLAEEIGTFEGFDGTTITSTGFWNVLYTVRARDSEGGTSNLRVRGTLSVVCSAQEDFGP